MSSRNRLTKAFIEALERDWKVYGDEVIVKVREENPTKYAELVSKLVPVEQHVVVEAEFPDFAGMSHEQLLDYFRKGLAEIEAAEDELQASIAKRERIRALSATKQ